MAIRATTQQIVDSAADELGLPRESLVPGIIGQVGTQALALLNSIGDDLVKEHDWQFLQQVATITGDGVAEEFDLPSDFGRIVNQTVWSSNNKLPMEGPLSPQAWGWVKYGIVSAGVFYRYRILDDKFTVFPVPPSGEVFNFFYISKNWVLDADLVTYKDTTTAGTDTPVFDRGLLKKALKVRLWGQKGFDTTTLAKQYNDDLMLEKAQDQGAPEISLSSTRNGILLDPRRNIPDGDWN